MIETDLIIGPKVVDLDDSIRGTWLHVDLEKKVISSNAPLGRQSYTAIKQFWMDDDDAIRISEFPFKGHGVGKMELMAGWVYIFRPEWPEELAEDVVFMETTFTQQEAKKYPQMLSAAARQEGGATVVDDNGKKLFTMSTPQELLEEEDNPVCPRKGSKEGCECLWDGAETPKCDDGYW